MNDYVRAVWRCRYFWLSLVQIDLRTRYRGSWLGIGWSLLQPLAMSLIICVAFAKLMRQPIGEFGIFLLVGLTLWNFLLNTTMQGCQCFRTAESYIRQYPAPLAIYPLRTALGTAFHFLLGLAIVLVLAALLRGLSGGLALLSLVPSLVLILLLAWALALIAGLATVHFPDTTYLFELAFQGLFFLTPVMFPKTMVERSPQLAQVFRYNPLSYFLRLLRDPIMDGHAPSLKIYLAATFAVVVLAGLAMYLLRRLEGRVVYYL
jgi:ABC-type polysaccharide/polyol phosphate export permease